MPFDFPMPMPRRMKTGLLLIGCPAALALLCLGCFVYVLYALSDSSNPASGAVIILLSLMVLGFFMLLVFSSTCLWGISRGRRIAAILALLVPVFLAIPFITVIAGFADSIAWIAIPCVLMLAAQVAIWPLAFGATARAWYRQWEQLRKTCQQPASGEVESVN